MQPKTYKRNDITYFVRGSHPTLVIWSGTHGDETEVTECVTDYIHRHEQDLPDYIYIPEVSPSAVAQKTRRNKHGRDLNRHFRDESIDEEAQTIMDIMRPFSTPLGITFHEDPDRTNSFYLYDSSVMTEEELVRYRFAIRETGAKLYTGIDDPADKDLSLHIEEGYISTTIEPQEIDTGFSMRWLIEHNVSKRVFNPEIPGKANMKLKQKLVDATFAFSLTLLPKI
jgi:hypothetical protein